jgi:hypothetical protein
LKICAIWQPCLNIDVETDILFTNVNISQYFCTIKFDYQIDKISGRARVTSGRTLDHVFVGARSANLEMNN